MTLNLSDPKRPITSRVTVTKEEVDAFLKKKGLPLDKVRIRRRARRRLINRKKQQQLPRGKDVSFTQSDAPWQIVYGQIRTGGVISFIRTKRGSKDRMHLVVTVAAHQINSIEKVYLDQKEVVFSGSWSTQLFDTQTEEYIAAANKVFLEVNDGNPSNAAIASLVTNCPSFWTANHKQKNRAHAYLIVVYDANLWPNDLPDITFLMKGKKCYDPRTGLTTWTQNPALIIADYLTDTTYGRKVSWSQIDEDELIASANICDENVSLKGGGTEKRYTCNGVFHADMSHKDIIEDMASSMAGFVICTGGKWRIIAGQYKAPSLTITEDDLRGSVELTTLVDKKDLFNGIRGTFVDPGNSYEVTDYPALKVASYVTQDGDIQLWGDLELPCTISRSTAQRLAKIELERSRRQIHFVGDIGIKAFTVQIGDTVALLLPRYGFNSKTFEVLDYDFLYSNSQLVTHLELREIDENVFAWDPNTYEKTFTPAPRTELPDPLDIVPPAALIIESGTEHLFLRSDGTVFSRMFLSWTAPDDQFVLQNGKIEVQYKRSTDASYQVAALLPGNSTEHYILDVENAALYNVRIRSLNSLGVFSDWIDEDHEVVGKTEKPSDVSGLTATAKNYGIELKWNEISDLDRAGYIIKKGANWAASEFIANVKGSSFTYNFLGTADINFLIKAVDTSGNESVNAAEVELEISAPGTPGSFVSRIIDSQAILSWADAAAGTYPLDYYKIYKGAVFATAELVGSAINKSFISYEQIGGEYTYHVTAVDTAGNESEPATLTTSVYDPPDYELKDNLDIDVSDGTFTNCVVDDAIANAILAPANNVETYQEHFDNNTFTTPQDQIDAGFPIYIQPTDGVSSNWELLVDYGTVLAASLIKFSYIIETISGAVTVTPKISVSADNISFTDYDDTQQIFAMSFRYVKYKLTFVPGDGTGLVRITNLNARLDVKTQTDSGRGSSSASVATTVSFNKNFVDVTGITVTPQKSVATESLSAVVDFADDPNPTDFDVYIFDKDGAQVARDFRWVARGVVTV